MVSTSTARLLAAQKVCKIQMAKILKTDLAESYARRFPKAGNRTLARLMFAENPALFLSLESARDALRIVRGSKGVKVLGRKRISDYTPKMDEDPFGKLPEPLPSFDSVWGAVTLEVPAKCLILADVHIPYYDKQSVITAIEYGLKRGADMVLLMGDICDCFAVSFWEPDPRARDFANEIKSTKEFLGVIRSKFPKAKIVYKLGNHEDRLERYMRVKAPELLGVPEFTFQSLFGLDEFGMSLVGDNRPLRLGNLNLIHGHEYRFAISNPVNPARGLFLRGKAHAACFHFHQTSQHSEKSLEDKVISTWSGGCLCDLHPSYRPINGWNSGFMYVEVNKDGEFQIENLRIVHGVAFL